MKFITEEQFEAFIISVEEESRTYNGGDISYPYVTGVLRSMLKSCATSECMRDISLKIMEDHV